jgi:SAM-dependent methyltransferase
MLQGLRRRAARAGLSDRIEARRCGADTLSISDLEGKLDFALLFNVAHEFPRSSNFLGEIVGALKQGGLVLLCEPEGHVSASSFDATLARAKDAGLEIEARPGISGERCALLRRA